MCPLKCQLWLNYRCRNHNFKLFCCRLCTGSEDKVHILETKKSTTRSTCWTWMCWNHAFYECLFYKMLSRFQSEWQWIDRINHCRTQDIREHTTPLAGAWPRPTGSSQLWIPAWIDRRARSFLSGATPCICPCRIPVGSWSLWMPALLSGVAAGCPQTGAAYKLDENAFLGFF